MLEGELKSIEKQPGTTEDQKQEIWTPTPPSYFTKSGLYHSMVKPGEDLKEGQICGTVTDLWGKELEIIRAPAAGRILGMVHNPLVRAGDTAVWVAVRDKKKTEWH
jgi:predicted deacylase